MQKVLSISNRRLYSLDGNKLITCDDQQPALSETPDYSICERLGLICEECRNPVFFAQEGIRAGGEDNLEPIIIQAHFRHYAAKATQFCSQRAKSQEGREAYNRVLEPIARGQWLSRFKLCFFHAILSDFNVPLDFHDQVDLNLAPSFMRPLSNTPKIKYLNYDRKSLLKGMSLCLKTDDQGRGVLHNQIEIAIKAMEESATKDSPHQSSVLALMNSYPGGMIAQRHCAHLALDFLLGELQSDLLEIFLLHIFCLLEHQKCEVIDKCVATRKANESLVDAGLSIDEIDPVVWGKENWIELFSMIGFTIGTTPWQHAWPYAVEEARRRPLAAMRKTSTRGKGFL